MWRSTRGHRVGRVPVGQPQRHRVAGGAVDEVARPRGVAPTTSSPPNTEAVPTAGCRLAGDRAWRTCVRILTATVRGLLCRGPSIELLLLRNSVNYWSQTLSSRQYTHGRSTLEKPSPRQPRENSPQPAENGRCESSSAGSAIPDYFSSRLAGHRRVPIDMRGAGISYLRFAVPNRPQAPFARRWPAGSTSGQKSMSYWCRGSGSSRPTLWAGDPCRQVPARRCHVDRSMPLRYVRRH